MARNDALYGRVMKVNTAIYALLQTRNERLEFYDAVEWARDFDDLPPWTKELILKAEAQQNRLITRS